MRSCIVTTIFVIVVNHEKLASFLLKLIAKIINIIASISIIKTHPQFKLTREPVYQVLNN